MRKDLNYFLNVGVNIDHFSAYGLKFAHEVHPQEQAYNIETAEQAIKSINGRKEFGFNFDPAILYGKILIP